VLKTPETLISQKALRVTSTFVVSYTKNFFDFQDIILQKKLCPQMGDLLQLGLNYDCNDLFDVFEFKTYLIFLRVNFFYRIGSRSFLCKSTDENGKKSYILLFFFRIKCQRKAKGVNLIIEYRPKIQKTPCES
jgi:hypothetical protein